MSPAGSDFCVYCPPHEGERRCEKREDGRRPERSKLSREIRSNLIALDVPPCVLSPRRCLSIYRRVPQRARASTREARGLRAADTSNRRHSGQFKRRPVVMRASLCCIAARRIGNRAHGDTTHSGYCLLTLFAGAGKGLRASGRACLPRVSERTNGLAARALTNDVVGPVA